MLIVPLYIKIDQKVSISNTTIMLKDIASIYCIDNAITKKIGNIIITTVTGKDDEKLIYSIMYIINTINKMFPNVEVINLGESDFIIEYLKPRKKSIILEYIKAFIVCLIVFFGSGFTIMTFNTDINVGHLFDKLNKLLLGTKSGNHIIEISYSIGIAIGIILFFNHFSRKKLEKELTPIQIEMRSYEQQINDAFIKDGEREGKMHDI